MGRIKPSERPKSTSKIKALTKTNDNLIRFSFKYTDFNNRKFSISHRGGNYLTKLVGRFKDLSDWCVADLCGNKSKALRAHPIKWEDTTEKNGFSLPEHLKELRPYQFQISKNKYGRVHGFFIDNIFFIVWLDPEHNLYS